MDKWTKLYQCVEGEYKAHKELEAKAKEEGKKEIEKYWRFTAGNYQYFMVLMDTIEREEEEGK